MMKLQERQQNVEVVLVIGIFRSVGHEAAVFFIVVG
jgi:hypothetical protein